MRYLQRTLLSVSALLMMAGCAHHQAVHAPAESRAYFPTDSTVPHSTDDINDLADFLNLHTGYNITIQGHTDSDGSDEYNYRLSKARADAIKTILVNRGVDAARIETIGYGETQPIASNSTAAGKAQNRRINVVAYSAHTDNARRFNLWNNHNINLKLPEWCTHANGYHVDRPRLPNRGGGNRH